jgi:histone H3/H4
MTDTVWKPCNICKGPIGYQQQYYLCSVSTCQRKRTGLTFCSVACFDAHLPMMRHRDAWAEPNKAPTREQAEQERLQEQTESEDAGPASPGASTATGPSGTAAARRMADPTLAPADDDDVLVVVSKLKKYIRTRSGMSTSDTVVSVLSEHLRELSVQALRQAASDGRKTVMDRDFLAVLKPARPRD